MIRTALLGHGIGGKYFHAPFLSHHPAFSLDAIVSAKLADTSDEKEYPGCALLRTPAELWERANEFDLAVVTTPTRTHAEIADRALDAGLNVLIDKPIATSSREARRLAEKASERALKLSVYQSRRFDAEVRTARSMIEAGTLGRIVRLDVSFERRIDPERSGWREQLSGEEGGGVTYDLGSHVLDIAQFLLGPIARINGLSRTASPQRAADDELVAFAEHLSGAVTRLVCSWTAEQSLPRIRLIGSAGTYEVNDTDPQERALKQGGTVSDPHWGVVPESEWGTLIDASGERTPVPTISGDYRLFYSQLAVYLTDGGPNPVAPDEAIRTTELIEHLLRS
ncbi:oxidoreductase [Leucobacter sp. Psy1]|uniref:Gfo/Idh/MocA family protein n=1 Tax=Leucobacter sp. Psy1 TaxID=2875729 RepID=UPI001CD22CC6|nr:Gfo/Idh/MocA family oxidoreductase [Leucobacter sp. Psy1]UBH07168.1 oxidoreductase [Leucobacter sp. Psy1]